MAPMPKIKRSEHQFDPGKEIKATFMPHPP